MLEWGELINVHLRGGNLQQFENDWNYMVLNVRTLPEEAFLESLFRKQLEKSEQLKDSYGSLPAGLHPTRRKEKLPEA